MSQVRDTVLRRYGDPVPEVREAQMDIPQKGGTLTDWTPIEDKILVRPEKTPDVSEGGVVLPEIAKDKPVAGEVIAVGPGTQEHGNLIPVQVVPGEIVLYSRYGGVEVDVDGESLLVLRSTDILLAKEAA